MKGVKFPDDVKNKISHHQLIVVPVGISQLTPSQ